MKDIAGIMWCAHCSTYFQLERVYRKGNRVLSGRCNCQSYLLSEAGFVHVGHIPILEIRGFNVTQSAAAPACNVNIRPAVPWPDEPGGEEPTSAPLKSFPHHSPEGILRPTCCAKHSREWDRRQPLGTASSERTRLYGWMGEKMPGEE